MRFLLVLCLLLAGCSSESKPVEKWKSPYKLGQFDATHVPPLTQSEASRLADALESFESPEYKRYGVYIDWAPQFRRLIDRLHAIAGEIEVPKPVCPESKQPSSAPQPAPAAPSIEPTSESAATPNAEPLGLTLTEYEEKLDSFSGHVPRRNAFLRSVEGKTVRWLGLVHVVHADAYSIRSLRDDPFRDYVRVEPPFAQFDPNIDLESVVRVEGVLEPLDSSITITSVRDAKITVVPDDTKESASDAPVERFDALETTWR